MACSFGVGVPRIPPGLLFPRNTSSSLTTSNSPLTSSHTDNLVLASSLGRGGGGVHGSRSRKGRRRRSRGSNDSQDELEKQTTEDGGSSQNGAQVKRVRKRSIAKLSEQQQDTSSSTLPSESEEVAPVASTVLTAPELFESTSSSADILQEEQHLPENTNTSPPSPSPDDHSDHAQQEEHEGTLVEQVKDVLTQVGHKVVDDVLPEQLVAQAGQVAQTVEQVALPVVEKVAKVSEQVVNFLSTEQQDVEDESDDEFESYRTTDLPEFRGVRGLENFTVQQENYGLVSVVYNLYIYILKKPVTEFALAMFAAPVAMSMLFTLLYLPQTQGLAFGEAASYFDHSSGEGLRLSWETIFQVFMFSVSLSTGLQPVLAPVTPYTLVVANVNALVAQLLFVFLSGAVFARLSQPSQPIRCSSVAIVSPVMSRKGQASFRVFMARYVLVGPQPCELVDVKVDLSYMYNTITRAGTYFRATQSLKLIRSEVAYLNHGMLVRHVIDETSPLNKRTPEMLKKEDGIFTLSVVGLERSSMQSVFHTQHYSIDDDQVVWNADFEDMILISKSNKRIVDHSRLSQWRPL